MKRPRRILLTATGHDRPGITSLLAGILEKRDARILDIGQSVLHGHLSLSILFEAEDAESAVKDVLFEASGHGLAVEHRAFEEEAGLMGLDRARGKDLKRYAVTLFAPTLTARMVRAVTELLARHGLNIDEILRLSELSPISTSACIEFQVSSRIVPDEGSLKRDLLRLASVEAIDLAIQPEGFVRRSKRLIAFDMDSTLIENEMIDEIALVAGKGAEVAAITHAAMEGKLDYRESLVRRVACLKGLPESELERAYANVRITAGARELLRILRRLGFHTVVLSGGFDFAAEKLAKDLGIDEFRANRLEIGKRRPDRTGDSADPGRRGESARARTHRERAWNSFGSNGRDRRWRERSSDARARGAWHRFPREAARARARGCRAFGRAEPPPRDVFAWPL